MSDLEICHITIVETKNELTKCEVMAKVFKKLTSKAALDPKMQQYTLADRANAGKIKQLEMTLEAIEAVYKDMQVAESPQSA